MNDNDKLIERLRKHAMIHCDHIPYDAEAERFEKDLFDAADIIERKSVDASDKLAKVREALAGCVLPFTDEPLFDGITELAALLTGGVSFDFNYVADEALDKLSRAVVDALEENNQENEQ